MRSHCRQRGMTFSSVAFLIAVGVIVAVMGMRLAPVYMEYLTVKSVVEDVAAEPGSVRKSQSDLWRSVERRLDINSVYTIKIEHITVEKHPTGARLKLYYEVRKPMIGNVDAVVVFDRAFELAP